MDLALHLRVLSRHKALLIGGLLAAALIALLSYVSVGSGGVSYRKQEKWQSVTRLFAAQSGYPFKPGAAGSSNVDPTTFAVLTSEFANSDAVRRLLKRSGKVNGEILAAPAKTDSGDLLPFIDVAGISATPSGAQALARRAGAALAAYVKQRQNENRVKPQRQIVLQVVSRPNQPELLQGRPKGTPLLIFLALASLTIGAIYVRENLSGQRHTGGAAVPQQEPPTTLTEPHPVRAHRQQETETPLTLPERGARRMAEAAAPARPSTLHVGSDATAHAQDDLLPKAEER